MNKYRCAACGRTLRRDSVKAWIRSYCAATGRNVRMIRLTPPQPPQNRRTKMTQIPRARLVEIIRALWGRS